MYKIAGIKHLFFDLDHTLWDFDRNSKLAFEQIFEKNRIEVSVDDFLKVYVPINFEYWKYYREARVTKEQLRYGRLRKSFEGLDIQVDDFLINRLSDEYVEQLPMNNYLFEGTLELLEDLSKNYEMHIITNGFEEVQGLKLSRSGMASYFKNVITSEAAGVKKPDPKIFHLALEKAGASVKNSLMIGDTYEADILGARGIGMETICFNYHQEKLDKNERVVNAIQDIRKYL